MNDLDLFLDRKEKDLWLMIGGIAIAVIWNVTDVEKDKDGTIYSIMENGKQKGVIWGVRSTREKEE